MRLLFYSVEVHAHTYVHTSLTCNCSSLCNICEKLLSSGRENPDHWEGDGRVAAAE